MWHLHQEVRTLKKNAKAQTKMMAYIQDGYWESTPLLGNLTLPIELQNIPLGEKKGLVLGSKEVHIRNVVAPFSPSLIKNDQGYLLFFRYDVIDQRCSAGYYTYIGQAQLDKNFEQTAEEYKTIDTGSQYSEDPRVVEVGSELYLFFNDLHPSGAYGSRSMRVGKINLAESKIEYSTSLDLQFQNVEKNWVPFAFVEGNHQPELYIEYYINPHKILKLADPHVGSLEHLSFPGIASFQHLFWPRMWGNPRGGSSALKVDDEYLSFFHSSFKDRHGFHWYVMGAYTFEAQAPFRVTKLSHYPILFEGIYDTPLTNTAPERKRVIFPTGFVTDETAGKNVVHVACGENDCAIKIVTLDREVLLRSMKKI